MIVRRLLSISVVVGLWLVWWAAAPIWVLGFAAIDAVRGRGLVTLRGGAMLATYLTCEVGGLAIAGVLTPARRLGLLDETGWQDVHFRLEAAWGTALFRAMVALFDMQVEVEGEAEARLGEGPYVLYVRHSSIADTLLASALVSRVHGARLRYVLKRELLVDPCLDVVGHRLPNAFVDRDSDDPQTQIQQVEAVARGLGPRDGVLIYPEGTRHTPSKRARIERKFAERGDAVMTDYLEQLSPTVLPPHFGGPLGLLAAAQTSDIVFCRHVGFERVGTVRDLWNGAQLGLRVRVRFDRVDRRDVPKEPDLQRAWLMEQWLAMGRWVEQTQAAVASDMKANVKADEAAE